MKTYQLEVNGEPKTVVVDPSTPLLWVLRDGLKLTGTKYGCGIGACGACTVHLDGVATRRARRRGRSVPPPPAPLGPGVFRRPGC
jgi:aerobic-type carbon monoxide dehydrogenase small subunit (CoxS/CutS family)